MHRYKIELVTMSDISEFVDIATSSTGTVRFVDGTGLCVSGKSLLGAIATIEWNTLYCVSDEDIYKKIQRFCVKGA